MCVDELNEEQLRAQAQQVKINYSFVSKYFKSTSISFTRNYVEKLRKF